MPSVFRAVSWFVGLAAVCIMVAYHLPRQMVTARLFRQISAEVSPTFQQVVHGNVLQFERSQLSVEPFDAQVAPVNAGQLSAFAMTRFLTNQPEAVVALFDAQPSQCMQRDACRLLYVKSAYTLGETDRLVQQPRDDFLWHALAGDLSLVTIPSERQNEFIKAYKLLRDFYPDRAESHYKLGLVNRSMGQWEEALTAFQQAAVLDGDDLWIACSAAEAALQTGQLSNAMLSACDISAEFSTSVWAYEFVGRIHGQVGDCAKARQMYETAQRNFTYRTEPQEWLLRLTQSDHPCGTSS